MSDFSENAVRLKGVIPIHIMSFNGADEVADDVFLFETCDAGNGFVEIATDYGGERLHLRIRVADLARAAKEFILP